MKLEEHIAEIFKSTFSKQKQECHSCKQEVQDATIKCEHCGEPPLKYISGASVGAPADVFKSISWRTWVSMIGFFVIIDRLFFS